MFDTFDRTGAVEFPFSPSVVFRAVETAISKLNGMKIAESNPVAGHVFVKTAMSGASWGEKVQVSVLEAGTGRTRMQIASGGKTVFGSAWTHSKNRKNVQNIISATSKELEAHGAEWARELAPTADAAVASDEPSVSEKPNVETRLTQLNDLHAKGLISDEDFEDRKAAILAEL